jgi:hypothetical protein
VAEVLSAGTTSNTLTTPAVIDTTQVMPAHRNAG